MANDNLIKVSIIDDIIYVVLSNGDVRELPLIDDDECGNSSVCQRESLEKLKKLLGDAEYVDYYGDCAMLPIADFWVEMDKYIAELNQA